MDRRGIGRKLILIGAGEFAEIACEYFTHDSPHEVVAFSAERDFIERREIFDLPVVPLEELSELFSPAGHSVFVAVTFTQLNRVRTRLYQEAKKQGFEALSYVSSNAFVWKDVAIGENCFIFENNVVQYKVRLGNNVILWSGNHIGHRSVIEDNCFISSHVVVSGYCTVGENSFLGVNSSLADKIKVGRDCVIGAGAVVVRDTEPGKIYTGVPARPGGKSSLASFGVEEG